MRAIEGASRMSSVLGLKVRPSTAMVLPRTLPPQAAMTLRAMARLRWSLTETTVSTMRQGVPKSWAVLHQGQWRPWESRSRRSPDRR